MPKVVTGKVRVNCRSKYINPLRTRDPLTGTLANSKNPDEMPHYAGSAPLLRPTPSLEKEKQYFLEMEIKLVSKCAKDHKHYYRVR